MTVLAAPEPLQIHPRALLAFEAVTGLLPSLGNAPHIETGLSGDDIEAAAWAEVRAIWQLLTLPPAALRNFARAVVMNAPDDLLQDVGLPLDRDLGKVLKRLPPVGIVAAVPRRA